MAKTIGKDRGSKLRGRVSGRVSATPETSVVDSSDDETRDEELVAAGDDGLEAESDNLADDLTDEVDDAGDAPEAGSSLLAPVNNEASTLRRVEGRPRTVHIPEWMMGNSVTRYVAESFVELRYNTTWPTWREGWNFTFIVILMSIVVAVILGLADFGLVNALTWLVGNH